MFTDHSKELIVGEIFVRVYNEQPTFPLEVSNRTYCHSVATATAYLRSATMACYCINKPCNRRYKVAPSVFISTDLKVNCFLLLISLN